MGRAGSIPAPGTTRNLNMIDFYMIRVILNKRYSKRRITRILKKHKLCHRSKYYIACHTCFHDYNLLLDRHELDYDTINVIYAYGTYDHRERITNHDYFSVKLKVK